MKKNISNAVLLSFLSQTITIIVGLVYTPIMIRILGQEEYGLYQLVQSVVNYLNLMNLGFNGAYIRFFTLAKTKNDDKEISNVNGMFFGVFFLISLFCILAGGIILQNIHILGENLTDYDYVIAKKLLILMVINLALSFPNSLFTAFMAANERFIFQKEITIVTNIFIPILNLPLLWSGCGSVGVVTATLFLSIIRLIINIYYCFKRLNMKIKIGYFDASIFKSLLGHTFFIFLSDIVDQLNSNVDKLLLGRISGTIAVAVYSVGYNLKHYYTIVSWIIPEMYIPEVNRLAIEKKDDGKLTETFTKIGRYNNYLVLLVLTGFIIFGKSFIYLWVGENYGTTYYVTIILMLAGYIPAVQTLGVNIQNAKDMHKMRSIVYFFVACLNVIVSIYFIKLWGVIGTCLGTLMATLIGHGLFMNYYYHNHIKLNVSYFWRKLFKWIILSLILCVSGVVILKGVFIKKWIHMLLGILTYVIIYFMTLVIFELNSQEKELLKKSLKFRGRNKHEH